MTQEKDKQEKPKQESPTNELPDADLDKVSGGVGIVRATKPNPAEPAEPPGHTYGRFNQNLTAK